MLAGSATRRLRAAQRFGGIDGCATYCRSLDGAANIKRSIYNGRENGESENDRFTQESHILAACCRAGTAFASNRRAFAADRIVEFDGDRFVIDFTRPQSPYPPLTGRRK